MFIILSLKYRNLLTYIGDGRDMSFEDDSFDIVTNCKDNKKGDKKRY